MKTKTISIRCEQLMYSNIITIPLAYYVPSMQWLANITVFAVIFLSVVGSLLLLFNINSIREAYKNKGIDAQPNIFTWRSGLTLVSLLLMYSFGYTVAAWLGLISIVISWISFREIASP